VGQADQRRAGAGGLLGGDPPDQVVGLGVAVGVFGGELGATCAAQRVLLAGQEHDRTRPQPGAEPGEKIFTSHETGVARRQTAQDRHATLLTCLVMPITVRGIIATVEEGGLV
jgi:hypothetical protein